MPRRCVTAARLNVSVPASVSFAYETRASEAQVSFATKPEDSSPSSRRVMPDAVSRIRSVAAVVTVVLALGLSLVAGAAPGAAAAKAKAGTVTIKNFKFSPTPLKVKAGTYAYHCEIHNFMKGTIKAS